MSAKNKTSAARKKRDRAAGQRAARSAHAQNARAESSPQYWHGGWPGLEPGTVLVGANEAASINVDPALFGANNGNSQFGPIDPGMVYFSSDRGFAEAFATKTEIREIVTGVVLQQGALYRVEPIGEISVDPDFPDAGVSWCAPRARIVAVEDANVMIDAFAATERVGPHMTWSDDSPMYSSRGSYLRSPEETSAGQHAPQLAALLPWTSISLVNAALTGTASGDRPNPTDHTGIGRGAAEAVDVLMHHNARVAGLKNDGVTFSENHQPVLGEINALIAPKALKPADQRGVVFARHPVAGVIGACVVTAMSRDGLFTMFVDRVAVTPAWRRRGVASVLLAMVQQILPSNADFAAGHCQPEIAPFFAQMGYTVLKPGVDLVWPARGGKDEAVTMQVAGECWFYRQGRI